ncbi:MAG: signal peptidase II [Actinobacteria bacterium]|nr:signal peptidase II [Actinomycetota bacterium]MBU1944665.1 signal peptidase II [Actinomycetota bacterium]MBU2689213.1 signal peptidase II [Actinomycetota bacterium]
MSSGGRKVFALVVSVAAVILLDQASKAALVASLEPGRSVTVIPRVLDLTHTTNTGAAFGLLQGSSGLVVMFALLVVTTLLVWFFWTREGRHLLMFVGLGLVVGGALGNLVDRLFRGRVIDFIDFKWWPVFNVADIAIVVGVGLIVLRTALDLFAEQREQSEKGAGGATRDA